MSELNVILMNNISELVGNSIMAIRTCWDSFDRGDSTWDGFSIRIGENDKKLIMNVINKGHTSTLEHINFTFGVSGISRAMLIELSRHRIASMSVKSTRYTLKKDLVNEEPFCTFR